MADDDLTTAAQAEAERRYPNVGPEQDARSINPARAYMSSINAQRGSYRAGIVQGALWAADYLVERVAQEVSDQSDDAQAIIDARKILADRLDEHMETKYGFVLGSADRDQLIDAALFAVSTISFEQQELLASFYAEAEDTGSVHTARKAIELLGFTWEK